MTVDTTTHNSSGSVQSPELTSSPSLCSGYITTKDCVFFDKHNSSKEFPEEITAQCYDDSHETKTDLSILYQKELGDDYVKAEFSLSDPRYILESKRNFPDFAESRSKSSSLHNLSSSLVISKEAGNSSQGCFSPMNTSFHIEDNENIIECKEISSSRFSNSDPECGFVGFQSTIRQDLPVPLNS